MERDELMNTIKEKITTTAGVARKKSGELVEITRLKFSVMDTEGEIKKLLSDIGTIVYEARKNDTEIDDSLTDKCDQIDVLYSQIAEAQARIDELRNLKTCDACGKKMAAGNDFCPSCGAKATDIAEEFAEDAVDEAESVVTEEAEKED